MVRMLKCFTKMREIILKKCADQCAFHLLLGIMSLKRIMVRVTMQFAFEHGGPAGSDRYAPSPTDIAIHCVLANHGPVANIYSVVLDSDDIVHWSSPRDGARFKKDVLKRMINP